MGCISVNCPKYHQCAIALDSADSTAIDWANYGSGSTNDTHGTVMACGPDSNFAKFEPKIKENKTEQATKNGLIFLAHDHGRDFFIRCAGINSLAEFLSHHYKPLLGEIMPVDKTAPVLYEEDFDRCIIVPRNFSYIKELSQQPTLLPNRSFKLYKACPKCGTTIPYIESFKGYYCTVCGHYEECL